MAGHPYLNQVKDPAAMAALRQAYDDIAELRRQLAALQAAALQNTASLNANSQRLINLGDATGDADAVNLRTAKKLIDARVGSF